MYVYKTTNKINGKIYIGISKKHSYQNPTYLGSGKIFKRAVVKYGKQNFEKLILEESGEFKYSDIQKLEIKYIEEFDSTNPNIGYNMSKGGDGNDAELNGMYGKTHSETVRGNISRLRIERRKENTEYGKRSGESLKRFKEFMAERNRLNSTLPNGHSEETKKGISKTVSRLLTEGKLVRNYASFSEERKQEYSERFSGENNPFYGRSHSEEAKDKIREAIGRRMPVAKKLSLDGRLLKVYNNIQEVKEDGFRIDLVRLAHIKNGTHKGFKWEVVLTL